MPERHILVVAVDGLRASALGAYGNTTFLTPALDQFAAESFLLDWCYAPATDLNAVYWALWTSMHPARSAVVREQAPALLQFLAGRDYVAMLVSDEPLVSSLPMSSVFDQCVKLADPTVERRPARADHIRETSLARLFAAACEVVASPSAGSRRLVWVHSRGMYGPWDAPLDLQLALLDEGDPPPLETAEPPDYFLASADDPDAIFRHSCAYAAQAIVLDACWNELSEAIQSASPGGDWLVVLLGTRGYPLGEHRRIGGVDARLYGEQLHVPCLVRFPDARGRLARSGKLASHLDLLPTIIDWIGGGLPDDVLTFDGMSVMPLATSSRTEWRQALVSVSDAGHRAIRTDDWCLRHEAPVPDDSATPAHMPPPSSELYVRPDDRWETNDVASLCPDVVEKLTQTLNDALAGL